MNNYTIVVVFHERHIYNKMILKEGHFGVYNVNTLKFRKYLPYAQISFACLIWGSYGLFVQGVEQPPQVIVFFRFLFGFLLVIIFN